MSDERQSRQSADLSRRSAEGAQAEGAKADLDRVIDHVAREMTEGALPGDFRARVMARITANDERRTTNSARRARLVWIFVPVAAAATVVVAIFLAREAREAAPAVPHPLAAAVAQVQAPKDPPAVEPGQALQRGPGATAGRPQPAVAPRAINLSDVEALAPPPPIVAPSITIRTLTTDALALEELEPPARIAIAPLATPEGEGP